MTARRLVRLGRDLDAVGAAELLPDGVEQPRLQQQRHRPQRQQVPLVVLNGPEKTIATWLFGAMPFSNGLFDHAGRRGDAEVAPGLLRAGRRQAGDVGLDERLDRVGREAADEDEREVAGVGEARLVERQRLRQVPLVHRRRRLGLAPRAVAAERRVDRLVEHDVGAGELVGEQPARLRRHRGERGRVGARLREPQVDQLEHRLEILRRAAAAHALARSRR